MNVRPLSHRLRPADSEELVASFTRGYPLLDPTRPDTGSTDSTYRLRINVEPAMLEPTES
jgi:predicted transcriptional regulator of viral defense system